MSEIDHYVTDARHLGGHRVFLVFDDGTAGEVDLSKVLRFTGVFEALRDEKEFARLRFDPEAGTIVWPSGADIAPETLYELVRGCTPRAAAATPGPYQG